MAIIATAAASTVEAEPIQVVYRVDMLTRCVFADEASTCSALRTTFPVTLTFDPRVTNGHDEPGRRTRFYGPPAVSDIPLPLRDDFPTLDEHLRQAAETARFDVDRQLWFRESGVSIGQFKSVDGNDFHRDLSFIADGEFPSEPILDGESFARFLGTAPFRQFNIADSVELASGGFEALSYTGRLSLESTAVTPEPASLLLVATGIAYLRFRRRTDVEPRRNVK